MICCLSAKYHINISYAIQPNPTPNEAHTCWFCCDLFNVFFFSRILVACFRATFTSLPNIRSMSYNELENTNNAMYRHEIYLSTQNIPDSALLLLSHFFLLSGHVDSFDLVAISGAYSSHVCEVSELMSKGIKSMETQARFVSSFSTSQICLHFNEKFSHKIG